MPTPASLLNRHLQQKVRWYDLLIVAAIFLLSHAVGHWLGGLGSLPSIAAAILGGLYIVDVIDARPSHKSKKGGVNGRSPGEKHGNRA